MDGNWTPGMNGFDPAENPRAFRDALSSYATGVTIITVPSPDGAVGITANSFASVSLDPPLVLWSPAKDSNRYKYFRDAPFFAIHVLNAHQQEICNGFTRDRHAFQDLDWTEDENGVPRIEDCLARFDCALDAAHDAGDHLIVIGRVRHATFREGLPLLFQGGRFVSLKG